MLAATLANHMLMTQRKRSSTTDRAPHPDNHPVAGDRAGARPLVLIVEDEPDVAELMRYNLAREGYATLIAESGDAAVEAALTFSPDLILLDIMLPDMNGWEVCQAIRTNVKDRLTPIVMVSALTAEESRIKGLSLGADDYITKPFSVQELLLKTRNIVSRHARINELAAREREQDTVMRYMVHELQNAVTAIGGFSSFALRKDGSNAAMRTINLAANHAESLLNDTSMLSRLENGKERIPIRPVVIGPLVDEAIDLLRDAAIRSNIALSVFNSTTAIVQGNRTAIRQILINLVGNAIKYNRSGGTVRISVDDANGRVVISVHDEGNGIAQAELEHVFDKFYRAAGSEQVKGAGLGLYIVKLLTNALGGKIAVASNPGKGSSFMVSFEALHGPAASPASAGYDEGRRNHE
ncbi:MAG: sensor histidine kinase [Nitrospirota bacterium]